MRQRLASMIAMTAVQPAHLVQDLALANLGRLPIFQRQPLRHGLALTHRQLHRLTPTAASEPATADTPLRGHSQMIPR